MTAATQALSSESSTTLHAELWVSFASLLRSYTSLHGLNRKEQATVELGEQTIIVRAGSHWLELHRAEDQVHWKRSDQSSGILRLTTSGSLKNEEGQEEEMDMQAEAWARELMQ